MPLEGICIEGNNTSTSNSPDLSLHISLPNISSIHSGIKHHKSTTNSFTELSLTQSTPNNFRHGGGAQQPPPQVPPQTILNPFHHQNQPNNYNHINHGVSILDVSSSTTDGLRPIKGIPVYHNRSFPFLPLDHHPRDKDPKMCFYPMPSNPYPSNPSSPLSHHSPYFGTNLDPNNVASSSTSSAAYNRIQGGATRFNGLSSYHYPQNNQFGVGANPSEGFHNHAMMMRSRFLPKLPAKRSMRAPRMRWTSTLHARFVHAVELLGGHESKLPISLSL